VRFINEHEKNTELKRTETNSCGVSSYGVRTSSFCGFSGIPENDRKSKKDGRYLYCIINSGETSSLGNTGIEDNPVYTIPYKDIAAVVHSCKAKPYKTEDKEKAEEWILSHNYVIDLTTKKIGTVLPFSFDTIVKGSDETVSAWLENSYLILRGELDRLKNKAEYSIAIFCDNECLKANLAGRDIELKKMKEKIDKMPKGAAYLLQRGLDLKVKDAIAQEVSRLSNVFITDFREHVEEMKEEKNLHVPEKYNGKKPVVGLTCLIHEDKVEKLGEELDEINRREGFAVRFTGPWAPYSFVKRLDETGNGDPVQQKEGL